MQLSNFWLFEPIPSRLRAFGSLSSVSKEQSRMQRCFAAFIEPNVTCGSPCFFSDCACLRVDGSQSTPLRPPRQQTSKGLLVTRFIFSALQATLSEQALSAKVVYAGDSPIVAEPLQKYVYTHQVRGASCLDVLSIFLSDAELMRP